MLLVLTVCFAVPFESEAVSEYVVSSKDARYTYSDCRVDVTLLCEKYPSRLKKPVLGKTADGRWLYSLTLGNPDAEKQIFVTAGIHARENINSQLAMRMIEYYCRNWKSGAYRGLSYEELFDKVCIVIPPMVNPDGIAISALAPDAIRDKTLRKKVKKMPRRGGFSNWQANARGVDLNRNYKMYSVWPPTRVPSGQYYPGSSRFSEKETRVVRTALDGCSNVKAAINLHSMGRVICLGYHSRPHKAKC